MATALQPLWTRVQFARVAAGGALNLAIVCVLLELFAAAGYRMQWWSVHVSFGAVTCAAWGCVAAVVFALAAAGCDARSPRVLSSLCAVLVFAGAGVGVPAWYAWLGRNAPPINDVSTDIAEPPRFIALRAVRDAARETPWKRGRSATAAADAAALQREHYPDIEPLVLDADPKTAYARALWAARRMGWDVVAERPAELCIEATATTLFMGFKDDVVVRITPLDVYSQVDVRSASRIGRGDLGTNARRIRGYMRAIQDLP